MRILLFKTNIFSEFLESIVSPILSSNSEIKKWNIDREDSDNILRIESASLNDNQVISMIQKLGLKCQILDI